MTQEETKTPPSYASLLKGNSSGRKKLNILDIVLERRDKDVPFKLNKTELSKLLFKKMKLDPKSILKLDTSSFAVIHIELKDNVNPDDFVGLPSFDIRDGLRVKYYRPHHRKESLVTLSWLDLETPDDLIIHVLSHFGEVKSNMKWKNFSEEECDGDLEKLLNNIATGERQIWMELKHNLPSYAVIDNRRVKIYYPGQHRTCARCQETAIECKGNANAKLCEENGGLKVNLADVWKSTLLSLNYREWKGEGFEKFTAEAEVLCESEDDDIEDLDFSNCDGVVISNLGENVTDHDVREVLKSVVAKKELSVVTIHPTGSTSSKIVKDVNPDKIAALTKQINKKIFMGRKLYCKPHVPISPPKGSNKNKRAQLGQDKKFLLNSTKMEQMTNKLAMFSLMRRKMTRPVKMTPLKTQLKSMRIKKLKLRRGPIL